MVFDLGEVCQLIGQRSHSNGKTSRRLRGHWVLPEVLKNPVAFLRMNPESKKKQRLLSSLAHLNLKNGDYQMAETSFKELLSLISEDNLD